MDDSYYRKPLNVPDVFPIIGRITANTVQNEIISLCVLILTGFAVYYCHNNEIYTLYGELNDANKLQAKKLDVFQR